MSTSLCTLFMINAFVRVKKKKRNESAPLESAIVSYRNFPADLRIDDSIPPPHPALLHRVPARILIRNLFRDHDDRRRLQSCNCGFHRCSRAQESPNIFYYCTIASYVILIVILLSSLCYYVYIYYRLASRRTLYILYISNAILLQINV